MRADSSVKEQTLPHYAERLSDAGYRALAFDPRGFGESSGEPRADWLRDEHGRFDVLVNDAGIDYDTDQRAVDADAARVEHALAVNLLGAWRTTVALAPLLSTGARIVRETSPAAPDRSARPTGPAARRPTASRGRAQHAQRQARRRSSRPRARQRDLSGLGRHRHGRPGGRPIEEGAAGIVWAATLTGDGPTGGFFRDCRRIPR